MMTAAIIIGGNVVLQLAALIIMQPQSIWRWMVGAMLIGTAYNLGGWLQP